MLDLRIAEFSAGAGPSPTLNTWCSMLQLHTESDMVGSRDLNTK